MQNRHRYLRAALLNELLTSSTSSFGARTLTLSPPFDLVEVDRSERQDNFTDKPVEAYTKSSPPHARAAALLRPEERSGLIRYVMTTDGPQPESRRSAPPDYEHYVQKQIRPIVESIAPFIDLSTDNLFNPGGQRGLF